MELKIYKIIDTKTKFWYTSSYKEKIKKAFLFFKNLPWLIGENTFPFFIVMISIAVILGAFFSVRNVVLIERRIPIVSSRLPVLDEKAIKGILGSWHFRQDKFDGVNSKTYPNLFSPKSE